MADRNRIEAEHRAATTGDRPREGDDPDTPTRAEAEADERRTDLWIDPKAWADATFTPVVGETCPDSGTCHHNCASVCWRVRACEPLSIAGWGDKWPPEIIARHVGPITRWFSFGYEHYHEIADTLVFDAQTIARITAHDPRAVMLYTFGTKWCTEYLDDPTKRARLAHMAVIDVPVPDGM